MYYSLQLRQPLFMNVRLDTCNFSARCAICMYGAFGPKNRYLAAWAKFGTLGPNMPATQISGFEYIAHGIYQIDVPLFVGCNFQWM